MAIVITHPNWGIYLGSAMGMGFWSKVDPVGQPCAVVFPDSSAALEHIASWRDDEGKAYDSGAFSFAAITPDMGEYASIQACVDAGLEGWIDELTPTANDRMC